MISVGSSTTLLLIWSCQWPIGDTRMSATESLLLSYNIRHLWNTPRNICAMTNGLSPWLRNEFRMNEWHGGKLSGGKNPEWDSQLSRQFEVYYPKRNVFSWDQKVMAMCPKSQAALTRSLTSHCCDCMYFARRAATNCWHGADLSHTWKLNITSPRRDFDALQFAPGGSNSMLS